MSKKGFCVCVRVNRFDYYGRQQLLKANIPAVFYPLTLTEILPKTSRVEYV